MTFLILHIMPGRITDINNSTILLVFIYIHNTKYYLNTLLMRFVILSGKK